MNPIFRVEAFIVPLSNRNDKINDNIIDDVKVANKLKNITEESPINLLNCEEENDKFTINYEKTTDGIIETYNNNLNNCLPVEIDYVNLRENNEEIINKEKLEMIDDNDDEDKNIESINNIETSIYDVPYSLLNVNKFEPIKLRERFEKDEYVTIKIIPKSNAKLGKPLIRTSSLMSIDERGETPEDCNNEFCCHGYKNGCTAITQRPEAVTEEIFEINWMKRLEQLRAREAIIKDKETVLFDRERLLFKKERELRILERLIKDKLKYAELYLKRCKSQSNNINNCDVESKISEQSKDSQSSKDNCTIERLSLIESLESCHRIESSIVNNKKINSELNIREASKSNGFSNTKISSSSEKILKNPPNSRSSLVSSNVSGQYQLPKCDTGSSYLTGRNSSVGLSGYSSLRIKKRPKVSYDDLDSTLSADIGDSSFVVTSKKFDPEIFKKPQAFTRTCSERRRPRTINERSTSTASAAVDVIHQIEEDKLMKRISENILISHDKDTKFQHYGLIDKGKNEHCDGNTENDDNIRHSYLDLEDGKKSKKNQVRNDKKINIKQRPMSWNEETNEWLQKKRQAYNLQTAKRILGDDIYNNKENHDSQLKLNQAQKKTSKGLKFNIFR
ncbi:hypothetical protein PV327_003460 [Microctonus hyperodae]|uniref:Uncharacterized protein n=1 Tax=Microctonus hyperodae TaxID=165561 RepID=A0AA39G425_MICHY|nr:hypothetical protein PV327_003460 [Microctonus hyperodae]